MMMVIMMLIMKMVIMTRKRKRRFRRRRKKKKKREMMMMKKKKKKKMMMKKKKKNDIDKLDLRLCTISSLHLKLSPTLTPTRPRRHVQHTGRLACVACRVPCCWKGQIILIVLLERLSMWNKLNCAEQMQIQKYKTHAYKTACVQTIIRKQST